MNRLQADVVVVGGGATGAGVVRDVAMRGWTAILVDRADLGQGTTGRYHGLLHSGGRYVVSDPHSATECARENEVVIRIHADAVEATGGLFVVTPDDSEAYADGFLAAATATGVPCEEVTVAEALRREPRLNPGIKRAFAVQDGTVDGWQMVWGAAHSAMDHGAKVLTYHSVERITRSGDQVTGVICRNLKTGDEVAIDTRFVINAAGPWAGLVAGMADCSGVEVVPGRGIMIAMNHRLVNTVVNRCIHPADGDILVPVHTVCVIGTTDVKVDDPDKLAIPRDEVQQMLDAGEALVPGFRQARAVHAWSGARPLVKDSRVAVTDTRHMSRGMSIIDHSERDGLNGLLTISGGKLTTYRLMAKNIVDIMAAQLGEQRPCTTDTEAVPGSTSGRNYLVTHRLEQREADRLDDTSSPDNQIICECELMSRRMLTDLMDDQPAATLDDLRRQLRLGMGPCQGGFCSTRAAGIALEHGHTDVERATQMLRTFLGNRWVGLWPILYGDQVRQTALDNWIVKGTLDVEHLPGGDGPLVPGEAPGQFAVPVVQDAPEAESHHSAAELVEAPEASGAQVRPLETVESTGMASAEVRLNVPGAQTCGVGSTGSGAAGSTGSGSVIVIGAGLAGLTAALRLRQAGRRVTLLTKGIGGIQLGQGTIDVLGRAPGLVDRPIDAIERFVADNPRHPYAAIGAPAVRESLAWLRQTLSEEFVSGDGERNLYLPTAVGAIRPTLLAPASMLAGRCVDGARFTIVGIRQVKDFHAQLVAENLDRTDLAEIGVPGGGRVHARHATIDFPAREGEVDSTGLNIARALDNPARRADFVARVRSVVPDDGSAIGLPAVLGALDATAWRDIAERLGRPVFEIPLPPPSVPGWRMNERLVQLVKDSRVRLVNGTRVIGCRYEGERLAGVTIKGTGRPVEYTADEFLLAGGGFESGALVLDSFNQLHETILGLPVRGGTIAELVHGDYWGDDQPLFAAGLAVDEQMRVLDADGRVAHPNVRAAGGVLAGAQRWTEKSGDAIALASALKAADSIIAATTGGPVEAPRQARGAEEQARGTDKGDNR